MPKVSGAGIKPGHTRNLGLCVDALPSCALENCSMQKKGNISNDERTAKACETQQFSKIDYGNRGLRFESGHADERASNV